MAKTVPKDSFPSLPLLRVVVRRELISRYRRHQLGNIWIFLSPLLTSVVMVTAFYGIFGVKSNSLISYSLYVLSGVTLIQFINATLTTISLSVVNAKGIYSRIRVPFLTFPISISLVQLAYFGVGILYCLLLSIIDSKAHLNISHLLVTMVSLTFFLNGLGMCLIVATSKFPDISTFLPIVLQAVTYISPIFYDESIWPEQVRRILMWNPFLYFIRSFRDSFASYGLDKQSALLFIFGVVTSFLGGNLLLRNQKMILKRL